MDIEDSSPKYIIFHTDSTPIETSSYTLYNSVEIQDSNPKQIFKILNNTRQTEHLYREYEGDTIKYIKITRQPAMELQTLPPPRNNILYVVTGFEVINDIFIKRLTDGKVSVFAPTNVAFQMIKQTMKKMETSLEEALPDIGSNVSLVTLKDGKYVLSSLSTSDNVPRALLNLKSKKLEHVLNNLHVQDSSWRIIIDTTRNIQLSQFEPGKGFIGNVQQLRLNQPVSSMHTDTSQQPTKTDPSEDDAIPDAVMKQKRD